MKKINLIAVIAITTLFSFVGITAVIAETPLCPTESYINSNARIKNIRTEECGTCVWWEINANWQQGDGAAAKYFRKEARGIATVQSCESGEPGEFCTSIMMTAGALVICPPSAPGSGGGSE